MHVCTHIGVTHTRNTYIYYVYTYLMQSEMHLMVVHREGQIGKNRSLTTTDTIAHTVTPVCEVYETCTNPASSPYPHPKRPSESPFPLHPSSATLALPCSFCRRFDAWIPVCHSTCNTAYWLVLDDPSRGKTPAHRSSTLNAPDAVANFDSRCVAVEHDARG